MELPNEFKGLGELGQRFSRRIRDEFFLQPLPNCAPFLKLGIKYKTPITGKYPRTSADNTQKANFPAPPP